MRDRTPLEPRIDAAILDFNGTIVDDEALLADVYVDLLRDEGVTFEREMYPQIAGLPDVEIFQRHLGHPDRPLPTVEVERLTTERVRRYMSQVSPRLVHPDVREFIDTAAQFVPLAITSGAYRHEIRFTLALLKLEDYFPVIVGIDDVTTGKPSPEGFTLALELLNSSRSNERPIEPQHVLVVEDATPGVIAARSAGMRTLALRGAAYDPLTAAADFETAHLHGHLARTLLAPTIS